MFNCRFCGKECKNENSQRNHERLCKMNPEYSSAKFTCRFCGKESPTRDGNSRHERCCKLNPDCDNYANPWNRGLTKETDERVAKNVQHMSETFIRTGMYRGDKNPACNPDVRAKISKTMMGNHNNDPSKTGRGKKGRYKGIPCSSTYELAFLIYCFDHKINVERYTGYYNYTYNGKEHRYYPDFIINNTIVEIKGFHTPEVDVKAAAVKDKNYKLLYHSDLTEVFNYIQTTYDKKVDKDLHDLYDK